jgi:glutamate formiminotransferase/formiminotetrahydrofolate cyclodeaminase
MTLTELDLKGFARELAGDSPAPGGGSVAALAGGLAAALCAMVSRLTLGRDKYKGAAQDMEMVRQKADAASARLLALVDEDAAAYNKVSAAFRMPKGTDEEKAARSEAIQEATKAAASTPLDTLRTTADLCDLCRLAVEKGNPNCITDAGVAAQLIRAAAKGAAYNVQINLSSIKDAVFREHLAKETDELLRRVLEESADLEERVERSLG